MVNSQFMLPTKQILPSNTTHPTATPRHTLTPTHNTLSFSQHIRRNASDKPRLKCMRKSYAKNETEGNEPLRYRHKEDRYEVVVREGQRKRSTYRFTYTEGHSPTKEVKAGQQNNFRLVIEGGYARRDLLKLNRAKLQAMIAKMREGKGVASEEPTCMAQIVLRKFQPRNKGFLMQEPRKSLDWKMRPDRSVSPKKFDTREYLICQSVRQEERKTHQASSRTQKSINGRNCKQITVNSKCDVFGKKAGPGSRQISKRYRRNPPKDFQKAAVQLKNSSMSLFDYNKSIKRMQTSTSFNNNTLEGWQQANDFSCLFLPSQGLDL